MKNPESIIQKTIEFVKQVLRDAETGHDWWHIFRVWKLAEKIAREEKADLFVVGLGALLHDIADAKFYNGDETIGPRRAQQFLQRQNLPEETIRKVLNIIRYVSFKNRDEIPEENSKELHIVRDADRLDALGALGIARAFSFGGYKKREMYNPSVPPRMHMSKEEYKNNEGTTINHFYEKLFLLKDMMHTQTGKKLAKKRHQFMEQYLEEFYAEWEGLR